MNMEQVTDITKWDTIAYNYSNAMNNNHFSYIEQTWLSTIGDVKNKVVLDLGSGEESITHEIKKLGSAITGIDGSGKFVEIASSNFPDINFIEYDLSVGLPPLKSHFDLIISHMTLMDIHTFDKLFLDVHSNLKDDGYFIFSILHPCFFNQKSFQDEETLEWYKKVTGYLTPEIWEIKSYGGHNHYHRSLSYYFDELKNANLSVVELLEPPHLAKSTTIPENFTKEFPLILIIKAKKI